MAKRISRVIRRARSAARKKGIPLDKLLPGAGALAGVLLGLLVGWILWAAVRATMVNYRTWTVLKISVDTSRLASERERAAEAARWVEAAGKVRDEILGDDFQKKWRKRATGSIRLGGACRLEAEMEMDPEGLETGDVVLISSGRPRSAAWDALLEARRQLAERQEPLTVKPRNLDAEIASKRGEVAGLEKRKRALEAEWAKSKPSDEQRVKIAAATERHEAARRKLEDAEKRLTAAIAREKPLSVKLRTLEARLRVIGGPKELSADQKAQRVAEQQKLERLLVPEALADSSAEHPVRKRLEELGRELERSKLPVDISKLRAQLPDVPQIRAEVKEAQQKVAAEEGRYRKEKDAVADQDKRLKEIRPQLTSVSSDHSIARKELAALRKKPHLPVVIATDGPVKGQAPALGWIFYLLGVAGGVGLVVVVHRRVMPLLTVIEDEVSLADKLRVPVLGKVPRLAVLERR